MGNTQQAIAGVFLKEAPNLQRFLARKLGGIADAEDAVQDTYVRILSSHIDERNLRSPKSFIFTVALNLAIDTIRRRQRERRVIGRSLESAIVHSGEDLDLVCPNRLPDQRVDDDMRLSKVLSSLQGLSVKCKRAFILHKFMDLSYAEVAQSLGVTVSMVEKYLSCALRRVREENCGREAKESP
jgi:RNA polymerase sigma factor (sigma-70 family)